MNRIALEEHFSVPDLLHYASGPSVSSDDRVNHDIVRRLADFDDLRLQAMDEAGVIKAVLSHTVPGIQAATDPRQAVKDARTINDYLARQIARHPDRFGGFATLPTRRRRTPPTSSSGACATSASTAHSSTATCTVIISTRTATACSGSARQT